MVVNERHDFIPFPERLKDGEGGDPASLPNSKEATPGGVLLNVGSTCTRFTGENPAKDQKRMKGLEHLSCEDSQRGGSAQPGEKAQG